MPSALNQHIIVNVHTDHPYSPRPVRVTLCLTRLFPLHKQTSVLDTTPVGSKSATGHESVPESVLISFVSPHLIPLYSPIQIVLISKGLCHHKMNKLNCFGNRMLHPLTLYHTSTVSSLYNLFCIYIFCVLLV